MKKLSGSEGTRKKIEELINEGFDASELMRNGMRLMIEQALEAEVDEALGRERYERTPGPAKGYRNGTRMGHVKTAEGVVDYAVPQVTGMDLEKAFRDENDRCALSKTAASEVAEHLWQDYLAFASRDLSTVDIVFLFVDGVGEKLHLGQRREPVLASWGITMMGEKHVLGLYTASKEDTDSARQLWLSNLNFYMLIYPHLKTSNIFLIAYYHFIS